MKSQDSRLWEIHRQRWGYFPTLTKKTENVAIVRNPSDYDGGEFLEVSCTQASLKPSAQKRLVSDWCEVLPALPVKSIAFRSRVNQSLFDAAARNPGIESLFLKWGPVSSLASICGHPKLEAIYFGNCPSSGELINLRTIPSLKYLFLDVIPGDVDCSIFDQLAQLKELGLSQPRGKWKKLENLDFLLGLNDLEVLWLLGYRIPGVAISSLCRLSKLISVRSSWRDDSQEMEYLKKDLPQVKYHESVFH
jgi:hypothetical protein